MIILIHKLFLSNLTKKEFNDLLIYINQSQYKAL